MITLNCSVCQKSFDRLLKQFKSDKKKSGDNYRPNCGSAACKAASRYKKVIIVCANCEVECFKLPSQLKFTNSFCSSNCSAIFNNKKRDRAELTKEIRCKYCNITIMVCATSAQKVCNNCSLEIKHKQDPIKSNCITCSKELLSLNGKKKYCEPCRHIFFQNLGKRIGKMSATKQVRRSKNEIYFADLCLKEFKLVSTNDPIFISKYGNWDADVIIHDYKIAISWNGVWHYKSVRAGHSLAQVQARDKIKNDVIIENGYAHYVIKDDGAFNKEFVEEQFNILKAFLKK